MENKFTNNQDFSQLYKVCNVGNKITYVARLRSKKKFSQWGLNLGSLMVHSDAFLTELTWQVLIEGYLTSLLLVHKLTFGFRSFT